jgi:excisionase family DNA binding protein
VSLPPSTAFGEPLLSAQDLATALGMTRRWVYLQVEQNGLPAYKLGRSLAFEVSAVLAWLDARRVGEWTPRTTHPTLDRPKEGEGDG